MKETLKQLFNRDLNRLKQEIRLYNNDEVLWKTENSIKNSGGNLCLHLIGNLKAYIGSGLANIDYIRHRDFEFSAKNIDRAKILKEIDDTIQIVHQGLDNLSEKDLHGNFPIQIWKKDTGMIFTLIHLHGHLNYHLGQINYHRKLLDSNDSSLQEDL